MSQPTCELCYQPGVDRVVPRGVHYGDVHYMHTFCARIEGVDLLKGAELAAWLAAEREAESGLASGPEGDPVLEIIRSLSLSATLISQATGEHLESQLEDAWRRSAIGSQEYAQATLSLHAITR